MNTATKEINDGRRFEFGKNWSCFLSLLDEKRIAWAAGDIIENRPALSRWHPDYADAFTAFLAK